MKRNELPELVLDWPAGQSLPQPLGTSMVVSMADGIYAASYACGQLSMLAAVEKKRVIRWLNFAQGRPEGCIDVGSAAQKYSADGQLEDFNPWDDSSARYPAEVSFFDWQVAQVLTVAGMPPTPRESEPDRKMPPLQAILQELQGWPGELEFGCQLYDHLRFHWHLSHQDAGQLATFLPAAAFDPRKLPEHFLELSWEGEFSVRRRLYSDVALFREARELAPRWRGMRAWSYLSRCLSFPQKGGCQVVAPPLGRKACPLRVLQLICELLLRQVGNESLSSLAAARMLAGEVEAPLDFKPPMLPWPRHPQLLKELRAQLGGESSRGGGALPPLDKQKVDPALKDFFLRRVEVVRDLYQQVTTGEYTFPLFRFGKQPLPEMDRRQWRHVADDILKTFPRDFPGLDDKVQLSRLENRIASLGLYYSGQRDQVTYLDELEDYLKRHGQESVHAAMWVLEGFVPKARRDKNMVALATRIGQRIQARVVRG